MGGGCLGFTPNLKILSLPPPPPTPRKHVSQKMALNKIWSILMIFANTVKPVYNGHPWDPKKVAVVQRWPVFGGLSIKIGIKISLAGLRLAVVDRWPLFRGGHYSEVALNTGLTVCCEIFHNFLTQPHLK
jgi:hypothetical protein